MNERDEIKQSKKAIISRINFLFQDPQLSNERLKEIVEKLKLVEKSFNEV